MAACYNVSMSYLVKGIRKVVFGTLGMLVLAIGLILLVLPGPGLLVCVLGLFILSLEFDWAKVHKERLTAKLGKVINDYKDKLNDKT